MVRTILQNTLYNLRMRNPNYQSRDHCYMLIPSVFRKGGRTHLQNALHHLLYLYFRDHRYRPIPSVFHKGWRTILQNMLYNLRMRDPNYQSRGRRYILFPSVYHRGWRTFLQNTLHKLRLCYPIHFFAVIVIG